MCIKNNDWIILLRYSFDCHLMNLYKSLLVNEMISHNELNVVFLQYLRNHDQLLQLKFLVYVLTQF